VLGAPKLHSLLTTEAYGASATPTLRQDLALPRRNPQSTPKLVKLLIMGFPSLNVRELAKNES